MLKLNSETMFLQEKPAKCLLLLRRSEDPMYASIIAREVDTTYAHTLRILSKLARLGFASFKPAGRIKLVELTEVGEAAAVRLATFVDAARLCELRARIERTYERRIKGRSLDKRAIVKRLRPYGRELKRVVQRSPELRRQARKLMRRIREIVKEGTEPSK